MVMRLTSIVNSSTGIPKADTYEYAVYHGISHLIHLEQFQPRGGILEKESEKMIRTRTHSQAYTVFKCDIGTHSHRFHSKCVACKHVGCFQTRCGR